MGRNYTFINKSTHTLQVQQINIYVSTQTYVFHKKADIFSPTFVPRSAAVAEGAADELPIKKRLSFRNYWNER